MDTNASSASLLIHQDCQTFFYTADFSTTFFYICLKPTLFCISHHETTSEHHKNFDSILQKEFCDSRQNGKSAFTQLAPLCLDRPIACGISRSFQTFLKHNVGNSVVHCLCMKFEF